MFEGIGNLQQSKGRSILVNFVVLSDIVIFLQENNQKYMFITPENKVYINFHSDSFQPQLNVDQVVIILTVFVQFHSRVL